VLGRRAFRAPDRKMGGFLPLLPAVEEAQRRGRIATSDPFGQYAFDSSRELRIALQDRDLQHSTNRYAAK
jgi:hypothetical protein